MRTPHAIALATLLAGFLTPAWAQAYTAGQPLQFHPGNAKARTMLGRIADLKDVVAEDFAVAMLDLNDDGRAEIIVQSRSSGFCGSGGCITLVVEQRGQRMVTLLSQNLGDGLGATQEKIGAYRALVALDARGAIAIADKKGTPLHGKPMIYPMAGAAVATATIAAPGAAPTAATVVPTAGTDRTATIVGIRLGMPAAEAEAMLRQLAAGYGSGVMRVNKYAMKAQCPGCTTAFDYLIEARMPLANKAPGNVVTDAVVVHLSPPPEGPRVISVSRQLTFKQPVAREALVAQIAERLGKPDRNDELRSVWHLGGGRFPVRQPPGYSDWRCSDDPSGTTSLFKQVMSDQDYPGSGVSVPLHNECGALLTLDAGGGPQPGTVKSLHSVLMDHRLFGRAAVAARAILSGQQRSSDQRQQQDARERQAPNLN
jgi:hypothetical protein